MLDLIGAFIIGFAGSVHCLGMCGPLVLAYSLHLRPAGSAGLGAAWPAGAAHHAAFHAGRLIVYGFFGAAASGLAGAAGLYHLFAGVRQAAVLFGGVSMVLFGLILASVVPFRLPAMPALPPGQPAMRLFTRLLSSVTPVSKLFLGMCAGCLPCMLSLAMVVKAATTGRPIAGFLTMVCFGAGTVPALFFTGLAASLLSLKARLLGERVAAAMVVVMGLILILKVFHAG